MSVTGRVSQCCHVTAGTEHHYVCVLAANYLCMFSRPTHVSAKSGRVSLVRCEWFAASVHQLYESVPD